MSHPGHSFEVCVLIRMCPILPFNVLNYALGATSIRPSEHFAATWLGMFPEELLMVYIGSTLHDVGAVFSGGLVEGGGSAVGFWSGVVGVVIFTVCGTWWAKRRLKQITDRYRTDPGKVTAGVGTSHNKPNSAYPDEEVWPREDTRDSLGDRELSLLRESSSGIPEPFSTEASFDREYSLQTGERCLREASV